MKNNWKKVKLSELSINNKGSYGIAASAVDYSKDKYTYLRITDITDDGRFSQKDLKSVDDINADKYILQPNDIVFARTGGSTGRNYFYDGKDGKNIVYAGFLIKFSINPELVNPKYIKYYCQSKTYKDWVNSFNTGSTRGNINAKTYENMEILLPSRKQQNFLVKILEKIDDKIELNNKINENLEQQARAIFKEKIINQCNNKNGIIGDYCCVKSGFAFKSTWWEKEGVKVIKIKNINNDSINLTDCSFVNKDKVQYAKEFIVKGGDLLIAMTGATIGKFAIVPKTNKILLVNQRVGKFFLGENPNENLPFLYCILKEQDIITEIINKGQGSAQANISGNDIMMTSCYIPNRDIIQSFNKICKPLFENIIMNNYENEQLANLRDTLLLKLINGEIEL